SVQALSGRVKIDNGKAVVTPLRIIMAGGTVAGSMMLDARTDVPQAGADLRYDNLDLGAFFKGSRYFETTHGKLQGRVKLTGAGHSLAPGHGHVEWRVYARHDWRIDQRPAGGARRHRYRRCAADLHHRRRPHPDPLRDRAAHAAERQCRDRSQLHGYPEVRAAFQRHRGAEVPAGEGD